MNHDYIKGNKEAWEESFEQSVSGYGQNDPAILNTERFPYITDDFVSVIEKYDLRNKKIIQLCCNNGRETMSIVKGTQAAQGLGIDQAENIVAQANHNAKAANIPCTFVAHNVLEVLPEYEHQFDAVFVICGAICWFEDLREFFQIARYYVKDGGLLFIQEIHPCTNMLSVPGEDRFDETQPSKIAWSYFKEEPFIDNYGIGYIAGKSYESKTFTSFSYKMSDVINGVCQNQFCITSAQEFDYDIGGELEVLNGKGFPLNFILTAKAY